MLYMYNTARRTQISKGSVTLYFAFLRDRREQRKPADELQDRRTAVKIEAKRLHAW